MPIFDAHIHYSHDVWDAIAPADAIRRLKAAGISRAMVSSSSDDGTQALFAVDPEFVIPVLRPYRQRGTLRSWMHDDSVIPYLQERLAQHRYLGIGEFHLKGDEAELPVIRQVVQLARQHGLMLHVHADADAIQRIFRQDPESRILWAHAGFEGSQLVRQLLEQHPNLWADLSFRQEIYSNGRFDADWQALLIDHSDRFLLGIDTYTPLRWLDIGEVMEWQRALLAALPEDVARRIGRDNGERVFATAFAAAQR